MKPKLNKQLVEDIRFAMQRIEEQLEVLAEGMSNEWNAQGYIDQQGIDQAIRARQEVLRRLEQSFPNEEDQGD